MPTEAEFGPLGGWRAERGQMYGSRQGALQLPWATEEPLGPELLIC